MKKLTLIPSATLTFYTAFVILLLTGCTKEKPDWSLTSNRPVPIFFDKTTNAPAIVQRIAQRLQRSEAVQPFAQTFIHYQGQPLWQQAVITVVQTANSGRTTANNGTDTLVKIPLRLPGYNTIHGYLLCRVSAATTTLSVVDGRQYTPQDTSGLAEAIAAELMHWNHQVFGHGNFALTDTRFFAPQLEQGVVKTAYIQQNGNVANNGPLASTTSCPYGSSTVFVTTTSYHCTNSGPCLSGVCDGCGLCVTIDTDAYSFCNAAPQQASWTLENNVGPETGGGEPVPPDFIPYIEPCNQPPTLGPVTVVCNLGWAPLDTGANIVNGPDVNLNGLSHICKSSFKFKKYIEPGVGGGGWQVAGVKDIHMNIVETGTLKAIRLTLPTMYFGLPVLRASGEFYSTDRAAGIAAIAVNKAEEDVFNRYKALGGSLDIVGMTIFSDRKSMSIYKSMPVRLHYSRAWALWLQNTVPPLIHGQ